MSARGSPRPRPLPGAAAIPFASSLKGLSGRRVVRDSAGYQSCEFGQAGQFGLRAVAIPDRTAARPHHRHVREKSQVKRFYVPCELTRWCLQSQHRQGGFRRVGVRQRRRIQASQHRQEMSAFPVQWTDHAFRFVVLDGHKAPSSAGSGVVSEWIAYPRFKFDTSRFSIGLNRGVRVSLSLLGPFEKGPVPHQPQPPLFSPAPLPVLAGSGADRRVGAGEGHGGAGERAG